MELEREGTCPNNLYLMLQGEVTYYKRPEGLYDDAANRIKIDWIKYISNPKDSGSDHLGMPMGQI